MFISMAVVAVVVVIALIVHNTIRELSGIVIGILTVVGIAILASPYIALHHAVQNSTNEGQSKVELALIDGEDDYIAFDVAVEDRVYSTGRVTSSTPYAAREVTFNTGQSDETISLYSSDNQSPPNQDATLYYSENDQDAYVLIEEFTATPYWITYPRREENYKVYNFVVPEGTVQNAEAFADYVLERQEESSDKND